MSAYEKCKELLRNYNNYKMGFGGKISERCVRMVDSAIESLKDDYYIGIITMHYIDKLTMERIAEIYDISTVTAYAQKKRLVHELKNILCSDDAIKEILGA